MLFNLDSGTCIFVIEYLCDKGLHHTQPLIVYSQPTTLRVVQAIQGTVPFALVMSHSMILPIQGLFNFIVYIAAKYRYNDNNKAVPFTPAHAMSVYDDINQ